MHLDVATPKQDHASSVAKGRWRETHPVEALPELAFVVLGIDHYLHWGAVGPLARKRRVQRELVTARVRYKRDAIVVARNRISLPVWRVVNDSEVDRSRGLMDRRLIGETNNQGQNGAEASGAQSDHGLNLFVLSSDVRACLVLSSPRVFRLNPL